MKWLGTLLVFLLIAGAGCTSTPSIASGTHGAGTTGGSSLGTSIGTGTATGSSSGGQTSTGGTTTGGQCGTLSTCPLPDGGSYCANEARDPANCGGCGHACPALTTCAANGTCACTEGTVCEIDGGAVICTDVTRDDDNCGQCGFSCDGDYGAGSSCDAGACVCDMPGDARRGPCAFVANGSLSCSCLSGDPCSSLSFADDVYPFLAQQSGLFGCSASGCHSGQYPQADLAFLDDGGQMDAGMAYAELLGTGKGGGFDIPFCDAGVPPFSPSTQCACFSRVVPGNAGASLVVNLVTNEIPVACADYLEPMPKDPATGAWVPLAPCSQQLLQQWVETGAQP